MAGGPENLPAGLARPLGGRASTRRAEPGPGRQAQAAGAPSASRKRGQGRCPVAEALAAAAEDAVGEECTRCWGSASGELSLPQGREVAATPTKRAD